MYSPVSYTKSFYLKGVSKSLLSVALLVRALPVRAHSPLPAPASSACIRRVMLRPESCHA